VTSVQARTGLIHREKENMAGALESIKEWPKATKNYIGELQNEMRKVTWPNAKQVRATTAVVILTVFAFAAFFQVVDSILNQTINRVYEVLSK
jgi:preprotein translocase subunit SecE